MLISSLGFGSKDSRPISHSSFFLRTKGTGFFSWGGCAYARWLSGTNQRWPEGGVRWVEDNQLHLAWQGTDFPRETWRQVS